MRWRSRQKFQELRIKSSTIRTGSHALPWATARATLLMFLAWMTSNDVGVTKIDRPSQIPKPTNTDSAHYLNEEAGQHRHKELHDRLLANEDADARHAWIIELES